MQEHHGDVGVVPHDGEVQRRIATDGSVVRNVDFGARVEQETNAVQVTSGACDVKWGLSILKYKKIENLISTRKITKLIQFHYSDHFYKKIKIISHLMV